MLRNFDEKETRSSKQFDDALKLVSNKLFINVLVNFCLLLELKNLLLSHEIFFHISIDAE
jgi:hypothetical protein